MNGIYQSILHNTAWLYTVLFREGLFFIDLWSFPHLWSGFALMILLVARDVRHRIIWLLGVLSLYELLELIFAFMAIDVFLPEILVDKLNDVVMGGFGGILGWSVSFACPACIGRKRAAMSVNLLSAAAVSILLAFFWVGSYGYTYNYPVLNSGSLNWWAFTLWTSGLFFTIVFSGSLRPTIRNSAVRVGLTWFWYALALLVLEYLGYAAFGIREVSGNGQAPLAFGLIHGPAAMKFYYIFAGVLAVGLNALAERALGWSPGSTPVEVPALQGAELETVASEDQ